MKLLLVSSLVLNAIAFGVAGAERGINARCAFWDPNCGNGQFPGSGANNNFLNGGFNPGKRCANPWDEDCSNKDANPADSGMEWIYQTGIINSDKSRMPSGRRFMNQRHRR